MNKPVTLLAILSFGLTFDVAAQSSLEPPNLYEFAGRHVTVYYATSSLDGQPRLSFVRRAGHLHDFAGDEIRVQETDIGQHVTVIARDIPDLRIVTLTLLIPDINVGERGQVMFETRAIFTSHQTTIAGNERLEGPLQTYFMPPLIGQASNVDFLQMDSTGVFGKVLQAPTCPGPEREGQGCVGPLADAEVRLLDDLGGVVASSATDGNGLFALHAQPGDYTIEVDTGGALPHCEPVPVTIPDKITTATVRCDTGIR